MTILSNTSLRDLAEIRAQIVAKIDDLKGELETLDLEIADRCAPLCPAPESGLSRTVALAAEGVKIKRTATKKVVWDQDKLKSVASSAWEHFKDVVKVEFSIAEKAWDQLDPERQGRLVDARTVKISDPKFALEIAE